MKEFFAIICIAVISYGTYYVVEHKDQLFSKEKKLVLNGVEYVAPNELDNPGYVYAIQDGQIIWKVDFEAVDVDGNLPMQSDLLDYTIRDMRFEMYLGRTGISMRVGGKNRARIYILDIADGRLLHIEQLASPQPAQ